jgi:glycosyltransferase involved in cell wall biosynthesis
VEYLTSSQLRRLLSRSVKYGLRALPRVRIASQPVLSPRVSVIIPTYNWSSVLKFAIRSVLWQTEQSFEILVVGDGCTDDSESVVRSFGDARIRWHNLAMNSGHQSAPNNAGIALARADYIAYQGHDDVWHPDHLRTLLSAAIRDRADFAGSLVEMIGPRHSNFRQITGYFPESGYDGKQGLAPSGVLHRRDVISKIGGWTDYRTTWRNPDVDLEYRAFEAGLRFVSTGELTVFKFNSTLRKNTYREKPCHEQAACTTHIERRRWFMLREAMRIARLHIFRPPVRTPEIAPPPAPHTPGWNVAQYRKVRGLDS